MQEMINIDVILMTPIGVKKKLQNFGCHQCIEFTCEVCSKKTQGIFLLVNIYIDYTLVDLSRGIIRRRVYN